MRQPSERWAEQDVAMLENQVSRLEREKALLHERVEELEKESGKPLNGTWLYEEEYEFLKADAEKWREFGAPQHEADARDADAYRQQKELGGQFISDEEYDRLTNDAEKWRALFEDAEDDPHPWGDKLSLIYKYAYGQGSTRCR